MSCTNYSFFFRRVSAKRRSHRTPRKIKSRYEIRRLGTVLRLSIVQLIYLRTHQRNHNRKPNKILRLMSYESHVRNSLIAGGNWKKRSGVTVCFVVFINFCFGLRHILFWFWFHLHVVLRVTQRQFRHWIALVIFS